MQFRQTVVGDGYVGSLHALGESCTPALHRKRVRFGVGQHPRMRIVMGKVTAHAHVDQLHVERVRSKLVSFIGNSCIERVRCWDQYDSLRNDVSARGRITLVITRSFVCRFSMFGRTFCD